MSPITLRRSIRPVLALALAGLGFVAAAPHAHAESATQRIRTYFEAIDGLTTAVDAWNADVTSGLIAAETKPEFVCSADFAELVRRGHSLTNDFEGTGLIAPSAVAANHDGAARGLRQEYEGLQTMSAGCAASAHGGAPAGDEIAAGKASYAQSARLLRYYAAKYR